jgi:hypothetical protein
MWQDPIVAEIRTLREAHAAKFNYDIDAIYQALKADEEKNDHPKASFPPKRLVSQPIGDQSPTA